MLKKDQKMVHISIKLVSIMKNLPFNSFGWNHRFNAKETNLVIQDRILQGVMINNNEEIKTNVCLFGIGHSARDTFKLLFHDKMNITQKAFFCWC